ncbi:hypothetical protein M422DRAFT_40799 [Sphaerobolus stellatus SS14]|nr:hypothetical protein M422DRAFT_40799 [Sphaerobolus stellatus SS14]
MEIAIIAAVAGPVSSILIAIGKLACHKFSPQLNEEKAIRDIGSARDVLEAEAPRLPGDIVEQLREKIKELSFRNRNVANLRGSHNLIKRAKAIPYARRTRGAARDLLNEVRVTSTTWDRAPNRSNLRSGVNAPQVSLHTQPTRNHPRDNVITDGPVMTSWGFDGNPDSKQITFEEFSEVFSDVLAHMEVAQGKIKDDLFHSIYRHVMNVKEDCDDLCAHLYYLLLSKEN